MGTQPEATRSVTFGPFEYDAGSGDLRKFGNRIRLQGKPLQILTVLLDHAGRIVTRDQLRRELWTETTFVDFDQGLNSAVNKLRQALGDAAEQPRYIETLPGRGYRFIAPIQRAQGRPVLEITPVPPRALTETQPDSWGIRGRLALVAALACLLWGSYWLGSRSPRLPESGGMTQFTVLPPPGFALEGAGTGQSFALSPDGRRLAFTAADARGAHSAFVRDLDELEARMIPESVGTQSVFWGADGSSLYLGLRDQLRRTSLDGRGHVTLAQAIPQIHTGEVIPGERFLLGTRGVTATLSISGGQMMALEGVGRMPQFLPQTGEVLYLTAGQPGAPKRATVRKLDGGQEQFLFETDSRVLYAPSVARPGAGHLLYVRSGTLVAHPYDPATRSLTGPAFAVANNVYSFSPNGAAGFSVSNTGVLAYQKYASRSQLVWVDRTGVKLGTIGPAGINVKSGRLSPDGRKLATAIYDVVNGGQNLWIFDVPSGAARELTLAPGVRDAPIWSPQSDSIAHLYASFGVPPRIHLTPLRQGAPEEQVTSGPFDLPQAWSSDGRWLACTNAGKPRFAGDVQGDISILDMMHGRRRTALLSTPFSEGNPAFSPDGKWLAYTSDESGELQLYLQAFESGGSPRLAGERYRITSSGALAVRWRSDGRELYHLAYDGFVYATSVSTGKRPGFGKPQPLFAISTEARASIHSVVGFDVSPDGKRFVIPTVSATGELPSYVVVMNWEAGIRR